jgi:hypothetical protein
VSAQTAAQQHAWQALLDQPLSFVRLHCVGECLPTPVSDRQLATLRNTPRFHDRLLRLLTTRFELTPLNQTPWPHEDDLAVLLLPASAFQGLARLCGAIWHAATLSREIRSDAVHQLRNELGNEVFTTALTLRSMAGAADLLRQPADLVQAIDRDGAGCVAAWLQAQPVELRAWLRLRYEVPPFDEAMITGGAQIVRRAVLTLDRAGQEVA